MTALPFVEIYAAKWRMAVGVVVGLWLVPLGLFLLGGSAGEWDMQVFGVALALLGAAMMGHYLRQLRNKRPSIVVTDDYLWHEAWHFGRLPLQCVRNVWLSERLEEGLSLYLDVDAAAHLPPAVRAVLNTSLGHSIRFGGAGQVSIPLGGLYLPAGPDSLREEIAYRAVAARQSVPMPVAELRRA